MDYSGAAAKAETIKITKASCAAIKETKALPETKHMISTVGRTGHNGALASFSLDNYKDIDAILNDMYPTVTKPMASFPTALLYTTRHLGGLGIPQFSVTVQQTKLRMVVFGLSEEERQRDPSESLLSRVRRVSGVAFLNG